jgi:hypothetical protein
MAASFRLLQPCSHAILATSILFSLSLVSQISRADGGGCELVISPTSSKIKAKVKTPNTKVTEAQPRNQNGPESTGAVISKDPDPVQVRVNATLDLLLPLLKGSRLNSEIAVDRILGEVRRRLTEAGGEQSKDAFASAQNTTSGPETLIKQNESISKLQNLLEIKTTGLMGFLRKGSVRKRVKKTLGDIESGSRLLETVTLEVEGNLIRLREMQSKAEKWQQQVSNEIAYLENVISKLNLEIQERDGASNLKSNFDDEILPRLLQLSNSLLGHQLAIAEMVSADLSAKVKLENATLENILTLKTVSQPLALRSASAYIEENSLDMAALEEKQAADASLCIKGDLCIGELVVSWTAGRDQGGTGWDRDKVVSRFEDGSYGIQSPKGQDERVKRSQIAKSTPGLSSEGISNGDHVISRDMNHWRIAGIFDNGDFLIKSLTKTAGIYLEGSYFVRVNRHEISKFGN